MRFLKKLLLFLDAVIVALVAIAFFIPGGADVERSVAAGQHFAAWCRDGVPCRSRA